MSNLLNEFILYLYDQLYNPYVWGGQHMELTRENYKAKIRVAERNTGGYSDGESYADAAIRFCEKRFRDPSIETLYGYDCSGLGMYWLYNLKRVLPYDMTAARMAGECVIVSGPPKRGYWVFRLNKDGTKISQIGYMVDDHNLIQARGRRYGVQLTLYRRAEWDLIGIPKIFASEILPSVEVIGNYVNIRNKDNKTGDIIKIAKKGERYPLIDISKFTGWYEIQIGTGAQAIGYISNRSDLTKII